jgi:hypothetical protein
VGHEFESAEEEPRDPGVVTVVARRRLPSDVVSELIQVIAGEARIVVCDLTEMASSPRPIEEVFAPVTTYLRHWPGSVVVCVPDPEGPPPAFDAPSRSLLVRRSVQSGVAEAKRIAPSVDRVTVQMLPLPTAARDARRAVRDVLEVWDLGQLTDKAGLVVSELVTYSILRAQTIVELSVSRIGRRVRLGVTDRGGGMPAHPQATAAEDRPGGDGWQLVDAYAHGWGVLPARSRGRTLWAVIDEQPW